MWNSQKSEILKNLKFSKIWNSQKSEILKNLKFSKIWNSPKIWNFRKIRNFRFFLKFWKNYLIFLFYIKCGKEYHPWRGLLKKWIQHKTQEKKLRKILKEILWIQRKREALRNLKLREIAKKILAMKFLEYYLTCQNKEKKLTVVMRNLKLRETAKKILAMKFLEYYLKCQNKEEKLLIVCLRKSFVCRKKKLNSGEWVCENTL